MAKARVWNRNTSDYSEEFKGKNITIPAGKFIEMELFEASDFKGKYPGKGIVKMIELERIPGQDNDNNSKVCNMCGRQFYTDKTLFEHLKEHIPIECANNGQEEVISEPKKRGRPKAEVINDSGADIGKHKVADR